ncbi:dihydrofolate reductase family protein [Streptomyces sp. WAC06614]|uniref:dihydrofolate reductase family protein n=1 Tax=Streptomyces sp. WAC06614 TaxID=2487416 RepID=UPI000F77AF62|nr:dihydrofolate reductase family protein [Streptomyces sp. WAC06614]RSS78851.1 dihydrofolate reductase [Streptomyces sp. WAC06614]
MRLVVNEFISLDGVVQAPGGAEEDTDGGFRHGGWTHPYFDEEVIGGFIAKGASTTDALLFGRRTWQTMAGAWPERAGDPFADWMNSVRKYVVSDTLTDAEVAGWENSVRFGGAEGVAEIRKLREGAGQDLTVMGSPTLVRTLLAEGLVDELRLVVMPVLLGGGKRIFPEDGGLRAMELVSSAVNAKGAQVVTYRAVQA